MNRLLVIGAGSIGRRHLKNALELGISNLAVLRSGIGLGMDLTDDLKTKVEEFYDENAAIKWKPDHIIISNPTSHHLKFIAWGIDNKLKIMAEKPIIGSTLEFNGNKNLYSIVDKYDGMVGYNLRFHAVIRQFKELLESKNFGTPLSGEFRVGHYLPAWHPGKDYRQGYAARKDMGGGVLRTLSHEIDLTQFFLGKLIEMTARVLKISDLEIDCDDLVDILAASDNCKSIKIHLNYLSPVPERTGIIITSMGKLEYDYFSNQISFISYKTGKKEILYKSDDSYDQQYIDQLDYFISDQKGYACTFSEGLEIVRIIEKCEESSRKGVTLRLD